MDIHSLASKTSSERIRLLKEALRSHGVVAAFDEAPSHLDAPIQPGAVTELSGAPGSGKSELVLKFLAENPRIRAAWIEEGLTVYPCAFPLCGVALARVLFVDSSAKGESLWVAHQVLKSQLFGAIVLSAVRDFSEIELRRLQLAAENSGSSIILLKDEPTLRGAWPISFQARVARGPSGEPQATPLKERA